MMRLFIFIVFLAACTPQNPTTIVATDMVDGFEVSGSDVITPVNALRAQNGLGPVVVNSQLSNAALRHARDMTANNFMDHYGSDGSSPIDRVRAEGYCFTRLLENVSLGYRSDARAIDAWIASPKHRANILKSDVTQIGMAGKDGAGWAMVLARPCS